MVYILPNVDLFYGGAWHDESSRVLYRDRIRISRGLRSEGARSSPTKMLFALENSDSRFSIDHPASPLFGLLGRNKPVRAHVGTPHPGAANFDTTDTTAHVAPSVDAPTADGLLLCAWATPASGSDGTYNLPASMTQVSGIGGGNLGGGIGGGQMHVAREAIGSAGPTGTRTATFSVPEDYVAASVLLHGTNPAVISDDSASQDDPVVELSDLNVGDWLVCVAYHGWLPDPDAAGAPPAYPTDLAESGWILLADTGVVPDTADVDAEFIRLRIWARRVRRAGTHRLRVDPLGRTLISLVAVSGVGEWTLRGHAQLVSMPPRRGDTDDDRWVPVRAAGILQRLNASTAEPLEPALRRAAALEPTVIAYWPMEDIGPDTTLVSSGLKGGPAARFSAVGVTVGPVSRAIRWAPDDDTLPGLGTLPRVSSLFGQLTLTATLPTPAFSGPVAVSYWTRGYPVDGEGHSTFTRTTFALPMTGSQVARWELTMETRAPENTAGVENGLMNLVIDAYDANETLLDSLLVQDVRFDNRWQHAAMTISRDGTSVRARAYLNGTFRDELVLASTDLGRPAGSSRFVAFSTSINFVDAPNAAPVSFGHPAVLSASNGGALEVEVLEAAIATFHAAGRGHVGEPAARRILRLCQEESIDCAVVGDPDVTAMMGAQRTATLLTLLYECEDVDHGILHEPREFVGLAYRTLGSLYNQAPVATVDFASGEVSAPWEPSPDDRLLRNDVTVTRRGGGSARSIQETGPLNVGDPGTGDPRAVGRWRHDPVLNLAHDGQIADHARWLRLVGTRPEARFPAIVVNLLREQELSMAPALVTALAGLDVGDKLVVQNPSPGDLALQDVEQLWVGSDELLSQVDWELAGTGVPASPYTVGVWADASETPGPAEPKRYSPLDSRVAVAFTVGTDTGLTVADQTNGNDLWSQTADFPLDIKVRGVRLRVTAIGAPTGAVQTMTVQQVPVNGPNGELDGIEIAAGEPLELWALARYAMREV